MPAKPYNPSFIHNHDLIRIHDGGDALRNDQLGGILQRPGKAFPDFCLRCRVHRAGAVVENQDFRLL